jgi:hypothetical protein
VIRRAGKWEDAGLRFVTSMAFARPLRVARNGRDSEHVAAAVGGERSTAGYSSAAQSEGDMTYWCRWNRPRIDSLCVPASKISSGGVTKGRTGGDGWEGAES